MKYYKLVEDNQIIGAVSSKNFIRLSPIMNSFLHCAEDEGEYISYEGKLYRATWMRPIQAQEAYTMVQVLEISEEEYNAYAQAIAMNEIIEEEVEEEPLIELPEDPIEQNSIEFIRSSKINEMSYTCRNTIENGFDITLSDGEIHHFSLDTQDQLNLITLSALAETQDLIPYHADGEMCRFYAALEMKQIVAAATQFKMYHTTYYNALKAYINSLDNIGDIAAVTYGMELPQEFQSDVLKAIT